MAEDKKGLSKFSVDAATQHRTVFADYAIIDDGCLNFFEADNLVASWALGHWFSFKLEEA